MLGKYFGLRPRKKPDRGTGPVNRLMVYRSCSRREMFCLWRSLDESSARPLVTCLSEYVCLIGALVPRPILRRSPARIVKHRRDGDGSFLSQKGPRWRPRKFPATVVNSLLAAQSSQLMTPTTTERKERSWYHRIRASEIHGPYTLYIPECNPNVVNPTRLSVAVITYVPSR